MGVGPVSVDWQAHPGLRSLAGFSLSSDASMLGVAFSGGADSTALLLAAWHLWPQRVMALHINHGLQTAAIDFEQHATAFCTGWGIPLRLRHIQAQVLPGDSVEAVARDARYQALAHLAREHRLSAVMLGQHLDDQAETVLLALSRGAGLPGLAAMPKQLERHGVAFVRPWLEVPGRALRGWLQAQGITHVDDPTNADLRFTRNRIRHQLLPAWEQAFPGYAGRLARTARHAAQAQGLLDEMAALDLEQVGVPPLIRALQRLSFERQSNVLRFWLRQAGARQASEAQMQALLLQIAACITRGHGIRLKVGQGHVHRAADRLSFEPA